MRTAAVLLLLLAGCVRERAEDPIERTRERIERASREAVPPGNYRIDIERLWVGESDSRGFSALFGYADETVAVAAGGGMPGPGLRIGVAREGFAARFGVFARSVQSSQRESSFLVTAPGRPASLVVGETRFLEPFVSGGVLYQGWVPGGRFAGTAVETVVEPAVEGRVRLTLTPAFTGIGDGGILRATELSTTVEVPLGTPILLASHEGTHESAASALFSSRIGRGLERAVILATVQGG